MIANNAIAQESLCSWSHPLPSRLGTRIERYWDKRAKSFGALRRKELSSNQAQLWAQEIAPHLPLATLQRPLRALDVGTGAGFMAMILASLGCETTGIDVSQEMVSEAKTLAKEQEIAVTFTCMQADNLLFADGCFDVVVARNVLWTLTNPEQAYFEWARVLRPGGVLLNFDADYGASDFMALKDEDGKHAHADIDHELLQESEDLRKQVPLSRRHRPHWDCLFLETIGFQECVCDTHLSERIYAQRDATYNPVPMFAIKAVR